MRCIEAQKKGEPEILLFENLEELQKELGHSVTHGLYDSQTNRIYATTASVAHELGHYKDRKSGRMILVNQNLSEDDREYAILRNELVAILYSWHKQAVVENFLPHEREVLELIFFYHPDFDFSHIQFSEIQDLAEELLKTNSKAFGRLKHLFKHYL